MTATALVAGCKPAALPCTSMGASALVMSATVIRLDVYGPGAHCDGDTIAPDAPPPAQSQVVGAGQPIKLDVPAGHHVLLLSAFGDQTATQLLGSACTETDVKADEPACFNLTVIEAPDAAMAPSDGGGPGACTTIPDNCPDGQYCAVDGNCTPGCRTNADCATTPLTPLCRTDSHLCVTCLAPSDCPQGKRCSPSGYCVDGCDVPAGSICPSALMCCSNLCLDTTSDLLNCGGCGRACAGGGIKGVATPNCSQSLCKPTCQPHFADCIEPTAPTPDDGCETSTNDPNHCGSCTNVCNLTHAVAACPSGTCTVGSCTTGFSDCDKSAGNGCECADLGDGNKGCCPTGGCEAKHSDGFGHDFINCTPFGTYNEALGQSAATAFDPTTAPASIFKSTCAVGGVTQQVYCNQHGSVCTCFTYADTSGTGSYVGRARKIVNSDMGQCGCALGTNADTLWK